MFALTATEMLEILSRHQYKPNWNLTVYESAWHGPTFRMEVEVENSSQPGEKTVLGINSLVPRVRSERQFLEWVMSRLIEAEIHEAREFFRDSSGKPVFDPHGEEG